VREGQDDVIDRASIEHRAQVGVSAQGGDAARGFLGVAHQAQQSDADIRARVESLDHAGRQLSAAHHHGIALVVAMTPREPEHLAEDVAGEGHGSDGQHPEVHDDHARVVVLPEEERHDADEDEGAQARGLGDVRDLGQP
jgi:hypothetical protein